MALTPIDRKVGFQKTVSIVGCGWLGFPLATSLISQGYTVKGSTTSSDKLVHLQEAGIEPYLLKVSDKLEGDFQGLFDTDVLVINIPPGRRDQDVLNSYPMRIKLLLEYWNSSEPSHVIMVSSTGVYKATGDIIDETVICEPERDSGKAVLKAESMITTSSKSYTILRMAGLVGGERQPGRWFEGRSDMPGGDTPVNMIHQDDCIRAITTVVFKSATNDVFNLCADEHPIKSEFYKLQSEKLSVPVPQFLKGTVPHKIVDNSKFKNQYDFAYHHPDPRNF